MTTEQATTEQATTEQATTEQATTEQATTEQATTEQATTEQATTEKPKRTRKKTVEPDPAIETVKQEPTESNTGIQDEQEPKDDGRSGQVSGSKTIKVYKLNEYTRLPEKGTKESACFDIRSNFKSLFESGDSRLPVYTSQNQLIARKIVQDDTGIYVEVRPYERIIVPTGAIFDIPQGYSLKIHPRSGTSLKQGINLINQEAVIDSDYVDELKLLLVNSSDSYVKIYHDERYAQGELQEVIETQFEEISEAPALKTDRTGGLGHTGTK